MEAEVTPSGAISFPTDRADQAREAAQVIVEELRASLRIFDGWPDGVC